MKLQKVVNRAVVVDLAENLDTLFAVSAMAKRGEQEVIDFVTADVLRELRQESGPVVFPRLRSVIMSALRGAKHSAKVSGIGMGEEPADWAKVGGLVTSLDEPAEKAGAEDAKDSGFDWTNFATSLLGTVVKVGTDIYATREIAKLEKDKLEIAQAEAAAAEQQAAQQVALYRQQQVAFSTQRAQAFAGPTDGLPPWVLPVGIGAAGLVAFLLLRPKKSSASPRRVRVSRRR